MSGGYDFMALYGMADHTVGQLIEPKNYDAVVESAEWGPTNDGSKGQWTVKFRLTSEHAGMPLTTTMTVSPLKNDGAPNDKGLGILFNQLSALGVPRPTENPQLWQTPGCEHQVAAMMVGRPALIRVIVQDGDDQYPSRNRVKDIRPARPGAPVTWEQQGQGQQFGQAGFAPPAVPGGPSAYSPMTAQQQWGQQPPQPGQQGAFPQSQPGQPGMGQFTPQGQAQQPWQGMGQPPAQQGYAQQPQGAPGPQAPAQQGYGQPPGPQPGQPAPWNAPPQQAPQQQPQQGWNPTQPGAYQGQGAPGYQPGPSAAQAAGSQAASSPSYNGQGWGQPQPPQQPQGYQQPQQDQQQGPGGGPALPPWAQ